jgi:AraC-like DNA-binding protein
MSYAIEINAYDSIPRDVFVTVKDYSPGTIFPAHTHERGQFIFALSGVITVFTSDGSWVVPSQHALWMPSGIMHEMHMRGPVTMLNAYVHDEAAHRAGLPAHCQVFGVSPLLRQLLEAARSIPHLYAMDRREGRIMSLLLDETAVMPPLPLNTPFPAEPRLARACRRLMDDPTPNMSIDEMASFAGMSRRTFTRQFRVHTGVSFVAWRQQACLLEALRRLGNGVSITQVSMDLGYSSPSAFTSTFRRMLGAAPSHYLANSRGMATVTAAV